MTLWKDGNGTQHGGVGACMSQTPAHDWIRPRLDALLAAAAQAGIAREVAIATLADLIEGPAYNPPPAPRHSVGPEDETRGGPQAPEQPDVQTDD